MRFTGGVAPRPGTRDLFPLAMPTPFLARLAAVGFSLLAANAARAQQAAPPAPSRALPADTNALFTPAYALPVQGNVPPPFLLRTVFRRLAAQEAGTRTFTETRNFSISKRPVVARGTLRYSRRLGLSMAYDGAPGQPATRVLVIDDKGLIERNAEGRERSVSVADRPELGALTDVYLNLLRGNSTKLFAASNAFFAGDKNGWELGLVPRDEALARRVGRAVVHGRAPNIERIETISGGGDVRQLELGPIRPATGFSPEELKLYFRGTEG